jgi:hypothetical protein
MPLVSTINDIPVYSSSTDLTDDQQEHGNLAVTVTPARLWIWLNPDGWTAVTSTTSATLAARVTRLEELFTCIANCINEHDA